MKVQRNVLERPAIDLTRHAFMREVGDMVVIGTWIMNDEQEDTEPALVILPRFRPPSSVIPCVIGLSAAYRYNDAKYCVHAAKGIANALGFKDSMQSTHRIADILHSHLPDLVGMPPDPTEAIVVADGVIERGDGSKETVELMDYQQIKQV